MFTNVYLCVANNDMSVRCQEFKSFEEADKYYTSMERTYDFSTMIPLCKFMPNIMTKYFLRRELLKLQLYNKKINYDVQLTNDFIESKFISGSARRY
jgi:hypothetical protein